MARQDQRISDDFVKLYENGWSLREISKHYGCCKNRVRAQLLKAGITLREKARLATHKQRLMRGHGGGSAYFGFCYLQGQLVPDPREYPTLLTIHRLWSENISVREITRRMNHAKIPSRTGRKWNWAVVNAIVERLKANEITITSEENK